MTRYDDKFAAIIQGLLDEGRGLSYRDACRRIQRAGGDISPGWISEMARGRVPSVRILDMLRAAWPERDWGAAYRIVANVPPEAMKAYAGLEDMARTVAERRGVPIRELLPLLLEEELARADAETAC